ncbi:MAG: type II toxin-antitoxin system Phd/YefM family antitoxin [Gammaproteobacteria bacterium]
MTVRQNLGEILNEVQYRHDSVLITKGGKPVAALVDIGLFEKTRLMRAEFDRMSAELPTAYSGVEQATAEAEIAEAVAAVKGR